jgi:hypothetical protein
VSGPSGSDQVRKSAYILVTPLTIRLSSLAPGMAYLLSDNCSRLYLQQLGTLQAITVTFVYTHPTANYNGLPRRYDITPNPNAAGFTATLSVCYSHDDLTQAGISLADEHRLVLYRYDVGSRAWVSYTSAVYTETNVITTTVTGFSARAIGIPETHEPTAVGLRAAKQEQGGPFPWFGLLLGVGVLWMGVWRLRRRRWQG